MLSKPNISMSISDVPPPKKDTDLYSFLSKYRSQDWGGDRTHTSIKTGSWYIPANKIKEFHDLYYDHTIIRGKIDKFAFMTEVPLEMSCVKIDIDMRWMDKILKRRYDIETITNLLNIYYDVLREIINYVKDEEWHAFVFEKMKPSRTGKKEDENKDGLHIMFPFLNVSGYVEELIRERVLERLEAEGTLDSLKLSNKLTDIVDKAVCGKKQCWQMYGSRKPKCEAYKLTHIFTMDKDEDALTELPLDKYSDRKLLDILSIRLGHSEGAPKTLIKTKASKLIEARHPTSEPVNIRANRVVYSRPLTVGGKVTRINDGKNDSLGRKPAEQLKDICKRVEGLGAKRVSEYKEWHKLGQILYNIHNADDTLLDAWIKKSETIPKYKTKAAGACKKEWTQKFPKWSQERPPGIGTLNLWLQADNPKLYTDLNRQSIYSLINASIQAKVLDYDVAKVLHALFAGKYKHVGGCKGGDWYEYTEEEHRWKPLKDSTNLRAKISTDLFATYRLFQLEASRKGIETGDPDGYWDNKRQVTGTVMNKLKTTGFKSNLMKEATELFNDEKDVFYKKLDSSTKLLGFTNGVYDLDTSEFRDGRPEDYISFTTGIRYVNINNLKTLKENKISKEHFMYYVKFITKTITSMFPCDCKICAEKKVKCGLMDYVMLLLATFIDGSTKDEQFHIWEGDGANGKSLLVELFQDALGDYAGVLDNTVLTTKRNKSGNATPELFDTKNKRFIVIQEIEAGAQIQCGLLKQLTGGDKITARGLYKDIETFKPQFKMVLTTNHLPKLPPDDGGVWRRVRATKFRSKFVEKPRGHWEDESGETISEREHIEKVERGDDLSDNWIPDKNEYPRDNSLKDKFKSEGGYGDIYKEVFLSMLIDIYNEYKHGKRTLIEPACVMEFTRKYQLEQDKIQQFIEDCIIETDVPAIKPLLIGPVWSAYQEWANDNFPGERSLTKRALQDGFSKKFGEYKSINKTRKLQRGWTNIRLVEIGLDSSDMDDDIDSLDV